MKRHQRPRHSHMGDAMNDSDAAAFDMTVAIFRQKLIPFFESHRHCPPDMCGQFSQEAIDICEGISMHLQHLIDVHNADRADRGLPPLKSFQELRLTEKEGFDA